MVLKRAKQKGITFGYCDTKTGQRVYPPPPIEQMTDLLPDQLPPDQVPAHQNSGFDDMYCKVTCYPPLGQATQIERSRESIQFTLLIETASSDHTREAIIWHDSEGENEWKELKLKPCNEQNIALLNRPHGSLTQTWFSGELKGVPNNDRSIHFTVKFRTNGKEDWRWIKDTTGSPDGELQYQKQDASITSKHDLKHFFEDISSDVTIQSERPETDDTLLYSLTCPVHASEGEDSAYQQHQLGLPKHVSRSFSLVRLWSPWLAPRHSSEQWGVDKEAVLVSFLRKDGMHVVCLGISGVEDLMTTFINDAQGNVIIKGRNDQTQQGQSRVLIAVADSFEVANCAVMYHARKVVGTRGANGAADNIKAMNDDVKAEWLEEWYDGLTYCTWNALGQNLTAEKIYNALDELKKAGITISNLIIDDNWQSLTQADSQMHRGWIEFEANKEGFPDGLKATTTEIRKRHPNIKHIAVWHAILGYWGGIAPNGKIAKDYKTIEVEKEPGVAEGKFTVVAAEDAQRMYNDFYSFLSSSGVDSVKTDAQFFLDMLHHAPDRRALITEYQDAWSIAHLRHFSSRAISCMSQTPQIMFHSQLPTNKPRLLVRNSDDFFPEVAASHPWHIFCNAYNSLFTQHLNVLPDWDMFQTSHEWAGFHAAARCVSGGPIYFTDYPGQHNIKLINQMTALTIRGKTTILRPHSAGRAMDPYNAYSAHALLKIGTYVGRAQTGSGILGMFNVSNQHLSEFVPLSAFPGTEQGQYIVGSFQSGTVSKPMSQNNDSSALVGLELQSQEWEILTAYALRFFDIAGQSINVACMGLIGKMTGVAAVSGYDIYVESNGRLRIWTSLKALGVAGFYISVLPVKSIADDFMVLLSGDPIPVGCVKKSETSDMVLEIDIERAWKESGREAGWSNDISFEVFMN